METAKTPAALLPAILDSEIGATVSPGPLTTQAALLDLSTITGRISDDTLDLLREIVDSQLPVPVSCSDDQFARCMKALDILPRRADDSAGSLRLKLYRAKLGGYSDEALGYLVSKGLEQFHFFPSIAECIKLLATFPNRDVAEGRKSRAKMLIEGEMQIRLGEVLGRLRANQMTQAEIDSLPKRWKSIAETKMLLWGWPDGRYTRRHTREEMDAMSEEQREAVRAANREMQAEWDRIVAARSEQAEAE